MAPASAAPVRMSGRRRGSATRMWPTRTAAAEMVARDDNAARWKTACPRPDNPLGARALLTSIRTAATRSIASTAPTIPGASEWRCRRAAIRMLNQDVVELYRPHPHRNQVIVLGRAYSVHTLLGVSSLP